MKRSVSIPLFLTLALGLETSCFPPKEASILRAVSCDIAFSEPTSSVNAGYRTVIEDGVAYILEDASPPDSILAYDLEGGMRKWRSYPYADKEEWKTSNFMRNFCVIGPSLWVQWLCRADRKYYLMEVDKNTGARIRCVLIGDYDAGFIGNGFNIVSLGSKVFFFNGEGLCYCDVDTAVVVDEKAGMYRGTVYCVRPYDKAGDFGIYLEVVDDDLVYSFRNEATDRDSGFVRFDPDSMRDVWIAKNRVVTTYFTVEKGKFLSLAHINESDGAVLSRFVSHDWETGESIRAFDAGLDVFNPPLCVGDRLIQASQVNYLSGDKPMLYCLDIDSLAMLWKVDVDLDNQSSGSNCQENTGIVYQPRSSGVWLYDLRSGAPLGKDEKIKASDIYNMAPSIKYKDLLVIQNGQSMLGIRMNFKILRGEPVKDRANG